MPRPSAQSLPGWGSWMDDGACRSEDPELFFHPNGERGPSKLLRFTRARAVCATCPVIGKCRTFADETRQVFGTWGGESEWDREARWRLLERAG